MKIKTPKLKVTKNISSWQNLVADLLEKAKQKGATQAEVAISMNHGFSLNVRGGQTETLEYHRGKNLGVTVYFGYQKGSATACDILPESLEKTLDAACHIAKATGEDPFTGLAEKEFLAYEYPELSLCHPWAITAEEGVEIAKACEAFALAQDKRIKSSEGATLTTQQGLIVYGNTHGFLGSFEGSTHSMSCQLFTQSEQGMQRDHDYTVARDPHDLQSIQQIATNAVYRTLRRLNPRRLATQQIPVLFDATIANSLIASFIQAISGSSQYDGALPRSLADSSPFAHASITGIASTCGRARKCPIESTPAISVTTMAKLAGMRWPRM